MTLRLLACGGPLGNHKLLPPPCTVATESAGVGLNFWQNLHLGLFYSSFTTPRKFSVFSSPPKCLPDVANSILGKSVHSLHGFICSLRRSPGESRYYHAQFTDGQPEAQKGPRDGPKATCPDSSPWGGKRENSLLCCRCRCGARSAQSRQQPPGVLQRNRERDTRGLLTSLASIVLVSHWPRFCPSVTRLVSKPHESWCSFQHTGLFIE